MSPPRPYWEVAPFSNPLLPTMLRPSLLLFASALLPGLSPAQQPALPTTLTGSPTTRYLDWSKDLDHAGAVVVVGRLEKWKEGKRERLADGQLGAGGAVSQVSGTQYFVVPVTATIAPRVALHGKAEKLAVAFELQLARLPDGKEQRQSRTGNGAVIEADRLSLFVVVPKAKGKGYELRHVIPFDPKVDDGPDGELQFVDTMRDFATVNQRVRELRNALAEVDAADTAEAKKAALEALRKLVEAKVELKVPANDGLLTQHVGPLEQRARKRLEAVKEAAKELGEK